MHYVYRGAITARQTSEGINRDISGSYTPGIDGGVNLRDRRRTRTWAEYIHHLLTSLRDGGGASIDVLPLVKLLQSVELSVFRWRFR